MSPLRKGTMAPDKHGLTDSILAAPTAHVVARDPVGTPGRRALVLEVMANMSLLGCLVARRVRRDPGHAGARLHAPPPHQRRPTVLSRRRPPDVDRPRDRPRRDGIPIHLLAARV